MKKRVVVTGAAGLVGQNLIPRLHNKGYTDIVAIEGSRTTELYDVITWPLTVPVRAIPVYQALEKPSRIPSSRR